MRRVYSLNINNLIYKFIVDSLWMNWDIEINGRLHKVLYHGICKRFIFRINFNNNKMKIVYYQI